MPMTIFTALLRGINVGGNNKIKMADLKLAFEELRFLDVQTFIQSGNVLFKADLQNNLIEEFLVTQIEGKIESSFGLKISVVLRTKAELERILGNCPFTKEEIIEAEESSLGESLYVSLLGKEPTEKEIEKLMKYKSDNEEFVIDGRNVYLLFKNSIRNSKLANSIQKIFGVSTTRNWKTMNKLKELAIEMERRKSD